MTIRWLGEIFVKERLYWSQYFLSSYVIGVLATINFIGALSIEPLLRKLLSPFEKTIRYLAGCTFALYLFHYPLLQFFASMCHVLNLQNQQKFITIGGTFAMILILARLTDRLKNPLKRFFLKIITKDSHHPITERAI
jgi:peptidoglycan/LPS O-acetylase OafA/YrhL